MLQKDQDKNVNKHASSQALVRWKNARRGEGYKLLPQDILNSQLSEYMQSSQNIDA